MMNKQTQVGITVVEFMVALLLGTLLLGGVLQVYLSTKRTYTVTEGLSRLQENTRNSLEFLAKDIRMAGYVPCGQATQITSVVATDGDLTPLWLGLFDTPVLGFEGGVSAFPTELPNAGNAVGERIANSDALVVLRSGANVASVALHDVPNNQIILQRDMGANWVDDGSLMTICNATNAALFQAGVISDDASGTTISLNTSGVAPGNCTDALGSPAPITCIGNQTGNNYTFGDDSLISDYKAVAYYVRVSPNGDGSSLYREYLRVENDAGTPTAKTVSEEILEGVESMQVQYGVDTSGNDGVANQYFDADQITTAQWGSVVTIRVGLLMTSPNGVNQNVDTRIYNIAGTQIGPGGDFNYAQDTRARYATNLTISLRN